METHPRKTICILAVVLLAPAHAAPDPPKPLPVRHAEFTTVPLSTIKPQGWMRKWLETQHAGLTGHVEDLKGRCLEEVLWGTEKMFDQKRGRFFYTVPGQWHEALMWFALLYDDPALLSKVKARYDWTLNHPDEDGLLGPRQIAESNPLTTPHPLATFARGLFPYYAETGDWQMLEKMVRSYQASKKRAGDRPWPGTDNSFSSVEILVWLYLQTGNRQMLDLALECAREQGILDYVEGLNRQPPPQDISECYKGKMFGTRHGVRNMRRLMGITALYEATGDKKYLTAAENAWRMLDRTSMLIDGCISAREHIVGNNSVETHETCVINFSSGAFSGMLQDTGDAKWADRIERVCLNAGLGAVTKDFRQLQYFSSPNQVVAQNVIKIGGFPGLYLTFDSGRFDWCCTANINRIIPSYIGTMWLKGPVGAVVAALYGPSTFSVKAGGEDITLAEKTDFPFSEEIEFTVDASKPARFPLWLRIPGWCEGAEIHVNGEKQKIETRPATFAKLEREFQPGDRVSLRLPMKVNASTWPDNGIALERGPLVYSLRVDAEKRAMDPMIFSVADKDKSPKRTMPMAEAPLGTEFPQLELLPKSPWNYALDVDPAKAAQEVQVVRGKMSDTPWSDAGPAPVELKVPARRVEGWKPITESIKGRVELKPGQMLTPDLPDPATMKPGPKETITLVPLGATCLRMTVFPKVPRAEN